MKHDKTSGKKHGGDDDLDEMREAFKRHKEGRKGGGSSKSDWDKWEDGKNLRRFLPRPGSRKFYTEGWTHFGVGPNNRAVRCVDEAHIHPDRKLPVSGTKCPRCKRFLREQSRINSEYQKGDEEGQAEWGRAKQKYVPRHQFYSNTLREDDEGEFEVKITNYGPQIWGQLMNYYVGDDSNVGDFTNVKSGTWLNVKKESKGGRSSKNIEYKVFPVEGPDISDAWSTIKEALHDLDAAAGKVISVEEFTAIENGIDVDKDTRDVGDDDSDSDRRRRKSRDDDSDDADDDDDDDDDDDRPVTIKKSRLAEKMKKRRRD